MSYEPIFTIYVKPLPQALKHTTLLIFFLKKNVPVYSFIYTL